MKNLNTFKIKNKMEKLINNNNNHNNHHNNNKFIIK